MKQRLIKFLKIIFSDIRQAIIGIIVGAIVLSIGGVYLFAKDIWFCLKTTMQLPTPLWVAILLVLLCCLYIYLKASKHLKNIPSDTSITNTIFIEIGDFKWSVTLLGNNRFDIHPIPYCKIHETKFVPFEAIYICPAYQLGCKSAIKKQDIQLQYHIAQSFIEHKLKNKCHQVNSGDGE